VSRKFPIVVFALVLGFTLFAVQEFQTIDEQVAENDEATVRISVRLLASKNRLNPRRPGSRDVCLTVSVSLPRNQSRSFVDGLAESGCRNTLCCGAGMGTSPLRSRQRNLLSSAVSTAST